MRRKRLSGILPGDTIIILDVEGQPVATESIATALEDWRMEVKKFVFLIGGPDGLAPSLKAKATARWSLGRITLPHPLVRVVLSEQLYRAWSINVGHPYHRAFKEEWQDSSEMRNWQETSPDAQPRDGDWHPNADNPVGTAILLATGHRSRKIPRSIGEQSNRLSADSTCTRRY